MKWKIIQPCSQPPTRYLINHYSPLLTTINHHYPPLSTINHQPVVFLQPQHQHHVYLLGAGPEGASSYDDHGPHGGVSSNPNEPQISAGSQQIICVISAEFKAFPKKLLAVKQNTHDIDEKWWEYSGIGWICGSSGSDCCVWFKFYSSLPGYITKK